MFSLCFSLWLRTKRVVLPERDEYGAEERGVAASGGANPGYLRSGWGLSAAGTQRCEAALQPVGSYSAAGGRFVTTAQPEPTGRYPRGITSPNRTEQTERQERWRPTASPTRI